MNGYSGHRKPCLRCKKKGANSFGSPARNSGFLAGDGKSQDKVHIRIVGRRELQI